ncbi:PCC domain-containing protein [Streptomyces sp. NPDC001279]|uniref:PCC domain-containing protein n=1 Tax=Streptomyces sp. NPDC001279 TaxID=3364556 RepID=UPI0036C3E8A6
MHEVAAGAAVPGGRLRAGPRRRHDAVAETSGFARRQGLGALQVTAVAAFSRATVGWFDRVAKDYRLAVDEQCEVLSLLGDIAVGQDGRLRICMPYWVWRTARPTAGIC